MKTTGRRVAIGVAVVGTMVTVGTGITFQEKLVEQWYLWRLDSPEEEDQELAAEKLGQMGSRRAVPRLVEILRRIPKHQGANQSAAFSPKGSRWVTFSPDGSRIVSTVAVWDAATGKLLTTGHGVRSHYSFKALVRIGRPAVSALVHLLEDRDEATRSAAFAALNEIDPHEFGDLSGIRMPLSRFFGAWGGCLGG